MSADPIVESLAASLHAAWCRSLTKKGWCRGDVFDSDARTHDAIVPFPELNQLDRRDAISAAEEIVVEVEEFLDYQRGDDREFTARDIRVGQEVVLKPGRFVEGVADPGVGRILSWEAWPGSELLCAVTVMWANGTTSTHAPGERDLRRVEPER